MAKQFLIDILVVLITPILFIGGYYFLKTDSAALLSAVPFIGMQNDVDPDLGKKTEVALALLSSMQFDDSLFSDPAYLLLKKYTVEIPSVDLGRSFPFTPPQILVDINRKQVKQVSQVNQTSQVNQLK
jgi:hypothetical protein